MKSSKRIYTQCIVFHRKNWLWKVIYSKENLFQWVFGNRNSQESIWGDNWHIFSHKSHIGVFCTLIFFWIDTFPNKLNSSYSAAKKIKFGGGVYVLADFSETTADRFFKVHPLLDFFRKSCLRHTTSKLYKNLQIYKDWKPLAIHIQNKFHKWGFKLFALLLEFLGFCMTLLHTKEQRHLII